MAVSKEIESEFLPDLGNELTGEQLIFEHKVYRANEAFTKLVEEIRAWFNSPVHNKCYPKSRMKNKNSWCRQMKKYSYNTISGVLYKNVCGADNIGELLEPYLYIHVIKLDVYKMEI